MTSQTVENRYAEPGRDVVNRRHHAGTTHRDAQDWWVPMFRGAWLVVVGVLAFFVPSVSLFALALFFATTAWVAGGAILTDAMWMPSRPKAYFAQGVLSMLIGVVVAFTPHDYWRLVVGAVSLWAIAMAAIDLVVVNRHRSTRGRTVITAAAAVMIIAGLLGFVGLAVPRLLQPELFGALSLLTGGLLIAYGSRRRRRKSHVSAAASAHRDDERRVMFGAT